MRYALLVVVLLAVAAAVTGVSLGQSDDTTHTATDREPVASNCGSTTGGTQLPRPATKVLKRVAFAGYPAPGWEQGDATQRASRWNDRFFAKFGLWVRGSDEIVLSVSPPLLMRGWTADRNSSTITLAPCQSRWVAFPGGFLIPKPRQCIHLGVAIGDQSRSVPFGIGVNCPA
jgi:hypothetical protein